MKWLTTKRVCSFTNTPYTGNPAWVIIGAEVTDDDKKLMKLARELNPLSDITFVFPGGEDTDISLRFFSQSSEIKFSGHGTIAVYFAIEDLKLIKFTEPHTIVRQRTRLGIQCVELRMANKKIQRVTVTVPVPQFIDIPIEIKTMSKFLGIPPVDISDTNYPMKIVDSGFCELILPIKSLQTLLDMKPNFPLMKSYCERMRITGVITYSMETRNKDSSVHMRHFAPAIGIDEDSASGGASSALGFYLVQAGIIPGEEVTRLIVEQGYAMGRDAIIYVHVYCEKKEILKLTFGGQAVVTFEGRVLLP